MIYCYGNRCSIREECKRYVKGLTVDPLIKSYWYHKPKRKCVDKPEDCVTYKPLNNKLVKFLKSLFYGNNGKTS